MSKYHVFVCNRCCQSFDWYVSGLPVGFEERIYRKQTIHRCKQCSHISWKEIKENM